MVTFISQYVRESKVQRSLSNLKPIENYVVLDLEHGMEKKA